MGSQLDQATLDNLLVPSPYDVNLVLRFGSISAKWRLSCINVAIEEGFRLNSFVYM